MKAGEAGGFANFVREVFTAFVAPLYKAEGLAEFQKFLTTQALADPLKSGNLFMLTDVGIPLRRVYPAAPDEIALRSVRSTEDVFHQDGRAFRTPVRRRCTRPPFAS
jgi:hypothetical protein